MLHFVSIDAVICPNKIGCDICYCNIHFLFLMNDDNILDEYMFVFIFVFFLYIMSVLCAE
jgi:hypothetical protein